MRRLIVGFSQYSILDFAALARRIVDSLGKPEALEYFPNLNPPLSMITTSTEAYYFEATVAEPTKLTRAKRDQYRKELELLLKSAAFYLQDCAAGNLVMLTATGYDLTKDRSEWVEEALVAPGNVRLVWTGFEGQVKMRCSAVKGCKVYQAQYRLPNGEWITIDPVSSSQKIKFNGLIPGLIYEFRVRGVGARGETPWSEVVSLRVM